MTLPSLSQKILRNTAWNFFSRLIHIPINICLVPFIINQVGASWYGIWVILFAIVDYFNLLDLGVGAATIKYIAEYYTMGKFRKIFQTIFTTCVFRLIFIPPLIVACFYENTILNFFRIDPHDMADAVFIFRWILLNFALSQFTAVFRNTLIGLQRIHINNLYEILYLLAYALMTLIVLDSGAGLKGLVITLFVLKCILTGAQLVCVINSIPKPEGNLGLFDACLLKDFFRYGIKLQFNSLAGLINFHFDKLLIGHFLKLDFVAFYELGSKLAMTIRLVPSILLSPLIPASAELKVYHDAIRLEKLYLQGTKYMFLMAAPLTAFLVTMGPVIMHLWLGSGGHPYAILALQMLAIGYCFNITAGAAHSIGRGIGVLKYELQSTMMIAIMNLILSLALIVRMGFIGALIGTSLAMIVGNGIYLIRFNLFIRTTTNNSLTQMLAKPFISACFSGALIYIAHRLLEGVVHYAAMDRLELVGYLLVFGFFFLGVFILCLYVMKVFSRADIGLFYDLLTAIRTV